MSHHLGTTTCENGSVPTFLDRDVDRCGPLDAADLAALISVPVVRSSQGATRLARRPSAQATARIRANSASIGRRPRRRLRKEVRTSARLLLVLVTLTCAACLLRSGIAPGSASRGEPRESGPTRIASAAAPAVWLRIETAPGVSPSMPEPPVVLPGYVLPDDGIEESHHAGR